MWGEMVSSVTSQTVAFSGVLDSASKKIQGGPRNNWMQKTNSVHYQQDFLNGALRMPGVYCESYGISRGIDFRRYRPPNLQICGVISGLHLKRRRRSMPTLPCCRSKLTTSRLHTVDLFYAWCLTCFAYFALISLPDTLPERLTRRSVFQSAVTQWCKGTMSRLSWFQSLRGTYSKLDRVYLTQLKQRSAVPYALIVTEYFFDILGFIVTIKVRTMYDYIFRYFDSRHCILRENGFSSWYQLDIVMFITLLRFIFGVAKWCASERLTLSRRCQNSLLKLHSATQQREMLRII